MMSLNGVNSLCNRARTTRDARAKSGLRAEAHKAFTPCTLGRIAKQDASAPSIVPRAAPSLQPTETLPTSLAALPNNLRSTIALSERHRMILSYFPSSMGVDDFIARIEVALCGYGFTGDNSIAMTNLCRDEVTAVLKDKIEGVFGSSFNTNGLGAVLTCGVTGMGAGLSHSPVCKDSGRERYVFFTFPHIAINSRGAVGTISRPGRPGSSCACGAVAKALGQLKSQGVAVNCKTPGVHNPLDPEYTILCQRLARRIRYERLDINDMDLCELTQVAERTITDDLEYLIEKSVDKSKADYAVIAGVQIHNWAADLVEGGEPSLEFVAPSKVYVVVNGVKTHLELNQVPALTPRQLMKLAGGGDDVAQAATAITFTGSRSSTLQEVPLEYLVGRLGGSATPPRGGGGSASDDESNDASKLISLPMNPRGLTLRIAGVAAPKASGPAVEWPSWQSKIRARRTGQERDMNAPTMDSAEADHTSFNA